MRAIGIATRAALCGVLALGVTTVTACSSDNQANEARNVGTLTIPLLSTVGENTYRLEAVFVISGAQGDVTLATSADEATLSTTLPAGSYSAFLASFTLFKDEGTGAFNPIAATVESSTEAFTVFANSTTTVHFQFDTNGAPGSGGTGSGGTGSGGTGTGGTGGSAGTGGSGGSGQPAIHVAPDGDDALALASNGATPFRNVQPAVDFADAHRDLATQVLVAAGPACGASAVYAALDSSSFRMRSGIAVFGNYESTGWLRCSDSETVLVPRSADGVVFGNDVSAFATLDGFIVRHDTTVTTTAVKVAGGTAFLHNVVIDPISSSPPRSSYGVDVTNAGTAFIEGSRLVAAAATDESIAVRAVRARVIMWIERNVVRASGARLVSGVWLENATGSAVYQNDIGVDGPDPLTVVGAVHVKGTSNVTILENDIVGGRRGVVFEGCSGGGSVFLNNRVSVANRAGDELGEGVLAMAAEPACDLRIDGNVFDALSNTGESVGGLSLKGPSVVTHNTVTLRNHGSGDASGWGLVCQDCEEISYNDIGGFSDVAPCEDCSRSSIALSVQGQTLVDANRLDGGCSNGASSYNVALEASGPVRIQNNLISGSHDCGGSVGSATSVGIASGDVPDIHSNLIEAGETNAADCHTTGVLLNTTPNHAAIRNNIVTPGTCANGVDVAEDDGDADFTPAVLENNDLVAGPPGVALYRDHGIELTTADEVNALGDMLSQNNFSAACPVPLTDGSPCVNAGTQEGTPDHDMEDQLRDDGLPDVGPDELIPPQGPFVKLDAAAFATCGMRANGFLECWGSSQTSHALPRYRAFAKLSAGGDHVCALKSDGSAVCWGQVPPSPPAGTFVDLSAGGNHDCWLTPDHHVICTGDPVVVANVPNGTFDAISSGARHSCGLRPDGAITCWGDDSNGQTDVPPGSFRQACAGYFQSCGLRLDGSVECWGDVSWLQDWAPPPSGSFEAVFCGDTLACALDAGGTIICWGQDNGTGARNAPSGSFKDVALGLAHGCAIRADDEVLCWGDNQFGQSTPPQ